MISDFCLLLFIFVFYHCFLSGWENIDVVRIDYYSLKGILRSAGCAWEAGLLLLCSSSDCYQYATGMLADVFHTLTLFTLMFRAFQIHVWGTKRYRCVTYFK